MKRTLLITLWLLVPAALLALHYGPGQASLARDNASAFLREAQAAEQAERWDAACQAYDRALAALPAGDDATRFKVRHAQANARLYTGELPEAMSDLDALLAEMLKNKTPPKETQAVRSSLASAQYYAAWLMRLESAPTEEWMAQAENARQHFRLLAEDTRSHDAETARDHEKNLEAVIRLERMDLSELQGLPLPKKCQGCKNCSQKCRSQKESRCKNPGEKKEKDARNAGAGKRPEGTGS